MPVTDDGQPDHLAHPGAGLGGGEVGAHPGAQVAGRADVEHPGPVVAEEVDAGGVRQPLGEVALAALGGADPRGEGLQLLERVHAEAAEPLHQPVQHVDGGAGVGQRPVVGGRGGVEDPGQRGQLAVGGVVAGDHAAGELGGVEHLERGATAAPAAARSAGGSRRRTARCAPPARSRPRTRGRPAARTRSAGASATIELLMPVSTAMNAGISVCGLTSVWNSPRTSPPRTLTAPISVIIEPPAAEPPVVSRSTTQKVRSRRGRPSSSKLRCDSQREGAPWTALLMGSTLERGHRQSAGRRAE